uniref:Uncharacterized protein n=1 Tax=Nannochloropsis gaditana (strain CCMP526) TaxID=1093141 RepID=I2CP54_NANGC
MAPNTENMPTSSSADTRPGPARVNNEGMGKNTIDPARTRTDRKEGFYVEAPSRASLVTATLRRGCCGCPPVRHVRNAPSFQHIPHITIGYRVGFSLRHCLASLFTFHNESINIWSHLLGTMYVFSVLVSFLRLERLHPNVDPIEYKAILTFLLSAVACLSFSTCYHTFGCMSERAFKFLLRMDLVGIALLIWGSYVPGIHYAFVCFPRWQSLYQTITFLLLLLGLGGAAFTDTHCPRQSLFRTLTFAFLVGFGLVPSLHWCLLVPAHIRSIFLDNLLGMFLAYGVGFFFWSSRFPERLFESKKGAAFSFDLLFSSHQLWHLCIFFAVYTWLEGILEFHHALHDLGCVVLRADGD